MSDTPSASASLEQIANAPLMRLDKVRDLARDTLPIAQRTEAHAARWLGVRAGIMRGDGKFLELMAAYPCVNQDQPTAAELDAAVDYAISELFINQGHNHA